MENTIERPDKIRLYSNLHAKLPIRPGQPCETCTSRFGPGVPPVGFVDRIQTMASPHLREETLNTLLALLLSEFEGIQATAEKRLGQTAIDITVSHEGAASDLQILIEAKIGTTAGKQRAAEKQARSRLSATPRAVAFALCYPNHLRDGSLGAVATLAALKEAPISFAPVRRFGPLPAWRQGSLADFANTLRHSDLPRQRVAETVDQIVRETAATLTRLGCAPRLASALALPTTKRDLQAAALIASLVLSNAALLHHRLRRVERLSGITSLECAAQQEDADLPAALCEAWREIFRIDYRPVFEPALAVVEALESRELAPTLRGITQNAISVADELASLRFDHAGPLYHRLLPSARYDGSFYTNNVSALLLARLALAEQTADWANVEALSRLKVIDPACGTGTLLMAAMHAIRDRYEDASNPSEDFDLLHLALVEDVLYGLDINRHGVQLAACNLTLGNPRVDYRRMNLFTMRHGPQADGQHRAGSIELLATARDRRDVASLWVPLPTPEGLAAERAEPGEISRESLAGQFDLVIMNPPFTRNDIRNRQYDNTQRRSLQRREIQVAEMLHETDPGAYSAIDQSSVESFFAPLADLLAKPTTGTLAQVAPTTALTGASALRKRQFLAERFQIETIVSSHDPRGKNFSENTDIHESLLVARRPGAERTATRFISLARMPQDAHEAILLSDLINRGTDLGEWGTEYAWPWHRVRVGDWSAAQFYDAALAEAMHDMESLAGTRLTAAESLCQIEPEGRRIRDAFLLPPKQREMPGRAMYSPRIPAGPPQGADWTAPILWDHATEHQVSMEASADVLGVPKPGKQDYARDVLAGKASRLLLVNRLRTNTVRISACYADRPLLGSAWVPVRTIIPNPTLEKALCAWWNSTPGILTLLHCRAKALDYPRYALASLRSLLVPDPKLTNIQPLADAFEETYRTPLLPWPQMHTCPTRAKVDSAAAHALRMDGRTIADWRRRIAMEPTVSGKPMSDRLSA